MFGLQFKETTKQWWGCRAIYRPDANDPLEISHDRQTHDGSMSTEFCDWIDNAALPWVRYALLAKNIDPGSAEVLEMKNGHHTVRATPGGSHGYVSIGCAEFWGPKGEDE